MKIVMTQYNELAPKLICDKVVKRNIDVKVIKHINNKKWLSIIFSSSYSYGLTFSTKAETTKTIVKYPQNLRY